MPSVTQYPNTSFPTSLSRSTVFSTLAIQETIPYLSSEQSPRQTEIYACQHHLQNHNKNQDSCSHFLTLGEYGFPWLRLPSGNGASPASSIPESVRSDRPSYGLQCRHRTRGNSSVDGIQSNTCHHSCSHALHKLTGHETTIIQLNHLATALHSLLLLAPLRATASKYGKARPHDYITSSEVHMWTPFKERPASKYHLERLEREEHPFGNPDRYNVSKLLKRALGTGTGGQNRVSPTEVVINHDQTQAWCRVVACIAKKIRTRPRRSSPPKVPRFRREEALETRDRRCTY